MTSLLTTPPIADDAESGGFAGNVAVSDDARASALLAAAPGSYPGGKGQQGVYQTIINQIPPHKFYFEPFLGAGTVMWRKRPARRDVGADINGDAISAARLRFAERRSTQFMVAGALGLLESMSAQLTASADDGGFDDAAAPPSSSSMAMVVGSSDTGGPASGSEESSDTAAVAGDRRQKHRQGPRLEAGILPSNLAAVDVVVYADPPYLMDTRGVHAQMRNTRLYAFEPGRESVSDAAWHERLLAALDSLPCYVLLSGYWSELYAARLRAPKWRWLSYKAVTRSGRVATEYLWMNYPEPLELHDYSYLGRDRRERERIKRKVQRWQAKLRKMPTLERQALLAAMRER